MPMNASQAVYSPFKKTKLNKTSDYCVWVARSIW